MYTNYIINEDGMRQIINEAFMKGVNFAKRGLRLQDGKQAIVDNNDLRIYMKEVLEQLCMDEKALKFKATQGQYDVLKQIILLIL